MKTADLYIRVSTDEQADRGYSQRNQDEVLHKFCQINSIQIRRVFFEDHSAKTFNRPKWSLMLGDLKRNKNRPDLILFTKWDRFSRNAADAYQMIGILNKLGIEPQAIEQPLDLSIPENKMMLAFYLAAPEVENDRRALNTYHGMRRARKEGRYMGRAPLGYTNKITEGGRKQIVIKEPDGSIMRWAFQELSKGLLAINQVRKLAVQKGIKCSKANFYTTVRNPVYIGKIEVKKFKDEDARLVPGQHEALISEELFYNVQDILDGKKNKPRPNVKAVSTNMFPLRGFLACPKCSSTLTASGSKGRSMRYFYYHCSASCGYRHSADTLNASFVNELKKYRPHPAVKELYRTVINGTYQNYSKQELIASKAGLQEIEKYNEKLGKARELLLVGDIDAKDYRTIKSNIEESINRIEIKLSELNGSLRGEVEVESLLNQAVASLSNLDQIYLKSDSLGKREIIGSIFPEKLVYDGIGYRTGKINEAAALIYQINNELGNKKNRTKSDFTLKSCLVAGAGLEPATFGL